MKYFIILETDDPYINKSAHTKKSGNLFNDPRMNVPIEKSLETFNDPGINKSAHTKSLETYFMILILMCPYKKVKLI